MLMTAASHHRVHPCVAIAFVIALVLPVTRAVAHPLDPLSPEEIRLAAQVMKTDPRLAGASFPLIVAAEPAKEDVLQWTRDRPIARRSRAIAMAGVRVFEVTVDLAAKRVTSVLERTGVEPPIMLSELEAANAVLANPEFQSGLRKRGITDPAKLFCAPFSAGYYGIPEHAGKRLVKVGCFDTRKTTTNLFGWPIERLYALLDLRTRTVLRVVDDGAVPISESNQNYSEAAIGELRPARKSTLLAQPGGTNIRIDGHEITWGNWRLHARIDPRVGTVISLARWQDRRRLRSVLYQGYLSEMFVPYMDADYGWYSRTYFDTGEYGAGVLASTLVAGVDCPESATFLPADFASDKGEPFTTPNALCIFERSGGDPIWRHAEVINQTYEGRSNVELVVRMAASIGNYDYLFDWIFNDAAEIEVRVGATGIDALKGVSARHMTDASASAETRSGTLVAPNLVAVNHDHYFNFRLDLDVDGPANSFTQDVYQSMKLPPGTPRHSMYVVEPAIAETEKAAQLDSGHGPLKFRIANESSPNAVGNAASYDVLIANHAKLLLDPDDWPAKRARFLQHDVWVTPYEPAERYAGGEYVLGSTGADGLAVWSERNRPIRNRDIVLWVNLGMHHLTRAEDLPVLPTIWHSFRLRPHNFFDRNPAIDLPRATSDR
jgi:primary-amine oxidase